MRTPLSLLALASLWIAVPCPAQGGAEPPAVTPSSTLLLRLRSTTATLATAREVTAQLHGRQIGVRMQCFDGVARHYADALREFAARRADIHRRAARAVPAVSRHRLGQEGAAEIEKLRGEARAITAAEGLTKQRITAELDPRLARLRELVLVTPREVLAADEDLAAAIDDLQDFFDDLLGWFDLYLDTMRGLDDHEAGRRHVDKHEQLSDPPPLDAIDEDIELLCLMKLPMSAHAEKVLAANDALRPQMAREEYLGTFELNRIRTVLGLAPLRIDPKLGDAARDHSEDMHKLGFFSHTSPVPGKGTPGQRAARFGTSAGAENIAAGQNTGAGAIHAWWHSPGHHKNMLGSHGRTGLGRCEGLWTQMFGG